MSRPSYTGFVDCDAIPKKVATISISVVGSASSSESTTVGPGGVVTETISGNMTGSGELNLPFDVNPVDCVSSGNYTDCCRIVQIESGCNAGFGSAAGSYVISYSNGAPGQNYSGTGDITASVYINWNEVTGSGNIAVICVGQADTEYGSLNFTLEYFGTITELYGTHVFISDSTITNTDGTYTQACTVTVTLSPSS